MFGMFSGCSLLKESNLSNFNTNNVTKMNSMFKECNALECLDLSNFNTENVTNMEWMFKNCSILKEIKGINKFDISKLIDKIGIFDGCNKLEIIKLLPNFNDDNNEKMRQLTEENQKLKKEIDDIFAINFMSTFGNFNFPIACKKTDYFKVLEEKLYQVNSELKDKNLVFIVNGSVINRYETLENNRIESGNAILIYIND